jgi:hypothetical protein
MLVLAVSVLPQVYARAHDDEEVPKLMVRVEAPEADVRKAVEQVTQDQIIHGTYSYDKERILYGAHSAESAHVFGAWKGTGTVLYKVADNVLSPRYFKDTNDIGTISVRYVVERVDDKAATLRIDAVFVDARNGRHPSLGNVEAAEFAAIQQHLRTILSQRQPAEEQTAKGTSFDAPAPAAQQSTKSTASVSAGAGADTAPPAPPSLAEMKQHVNALQHEVELRVKDQGAQLKASPFHSAATLETVPAQAEVLIVVLTPYWYGVETEDGHRGWIHHSQLEPLP